MARLGELERAVMNILWATDEALTARQIATALPNRDLAKTTILTILSRLEGKGQVKRSRDSWAHTYRPTTGRADYVAQLMHEALGDAVDRTAALARFVGHVRPEEARALQAALIQALAKDAEQSSSPPELPIR